MTPPKILFIGLDAGNPDLIAEGCDAGWLPVLRDLRQRGAWSSVSTPRGFGDGAIWPSVSFGVNPGRHGRYFFLQLKPGTYNIEKFLEDRDFNNTPFWKYLSEAGRRVAVIDMVKAPLVENINGIQVADWTVHSRYGQMRSAPAHLISEIVARFGADPFNGKTDIPKERSAEEYKAFRDATIERVRTKTALCEQYLAQDSWDLFMVAYGDPHDIGHQCWHLHDPTHATYDSRWVERFGDPVKDVYIALDTAIGRLLDHAGPQTTTMVFAGPCIGPDYTGNFLFDRLLRRLDGRPEKDRDPIPKALLRHIHPLALRKVARRVNQARLMRYMSRCRFFAVPHNENAGAVRINVRGREPAGCVERGAEYDTVCRALTKDLMELVNAETGKPVVTEVVRVAEECRGELVDTLPDLLVVWSREAPIRAVSSSKIGVVSATPVVGARTGDHNPDCVLLTHGPKMTRMGRTAPIKVEDIAPTIAAFLGVAMPDVDGAPVALDKAS